MNNKPKHLKAILLFILILVLLVIITCYFNKKKSQHFKGKEGFQNELVTDVLLGKQFNNPDKNRISLSDTIDNDVNKLDLIYSTFKTVDHIEDENREVLFFRTNIGNKESNKKIIGDLVAEVDINNLKYKNTTLLGNDKNVPHLLNYKEGISNGIPLTKDDIKIEGDLPSIFYKNITPIDTTEFLLNILNLKQEEMYLNDNYRKIYNFYNNGVKDIEFLSKNPNQVLNNPAYITYSPDINNPEFKIIDSVKYFEVLEIYNSDLQKKTNTINSENNNENNNKNNNESNFKKYLSNIVSSIISTLNEGQIPTADSLEEDSTIKLKIYAGYKINNIKYTIPFKLKTEDEELLDLHNKYRIKDELRTLSYSETDEINSTIYQALITNTLVKFEKVILFKGTQFEILINYPYFEVELDTSLYDTLNITSSSINTSIIDRYGEYEFSTLWNDLNDNYISKINAIINMEDRVADDILLDFPLNIIQMKNPTDTDEHIIFGDIIDTGNIYNNDDDNLNILSNYVKIPRRCCYKTKHFYGDTTGPVPNPILTLKSQTEIEYSIYQHPIYKTFKIFKTQNEPQENKFIYEIEPCADNIKIYENNITKYNTLKTKCSNIDTMNKTNKIKDNSFNELQVKTKLYKINKNKSNLDTIRKEIYNLEKEFNKKDILKTNYNRKTLQKYNEKKQDQLYEAQKRLNANDSIGINILYPKEVLDNLINQCDTGELLECKTNTDLLAQLKQLRTDILTKDEKKIVLPNSMEIVKLIPDVNSKEFTEEYIRKTLIPMLMKDLE
jgi:hypothetical protein